SKIPESPLGERQSPTVIWSSRTHELIEWGGSGLATGAAFNPNTGTWRTLAPSPLSGRQQQAAAWDGTRMIIAWGLQNNASTGETIVFNDAAEYDPQTDTWASLHAPPREARIERVAQLSLRDSIAFFGGFAGEGRLEHDGVLFTQRNGWTKIPKL